MRSFRSEDGNVSRERYDKVSDIDKRTKVDIVW